MTGAVLTPVPQGRDVDVEFFTEHPDREAHIRTAFTGEYRKQFKTLGEHAERRRRILLWKVPQGSSYGEGGIVRIPFLAFADETIADDDKTLLPIIHEVMLDAAKRYGM